MRYAKKGATLLRDALPKRPTAQQLLEQTEQIVTTHGLHRSAESNG